MLVGVVLVGEWERGPGGGDVGDWVMYWTFQAISCE